MKKLIPILFIAVTHVYPQCSNSVGPLSPTITGTNTSVGIVSWSNTGNIISSNNSYASAGVLLGVLASANTQYITVSGFNFTVPASAAVCGIQLTIERSAAGLLIGSSIVDNSIMAMKGGVLTGSNMASGSGWSGSDVTATYGGSGQMWGTTWTPADVNAGNFGFAISSRMNAGLASLFLTANLDHVTATVFYNDPLPVELVEFTSVQINDREFELRWSTASETNNDYFLVEYSEDAAQWLQAGVVNAKGNSNVWIEYQYHLGIVPATTYYRLSQFDKNGQQHPLGIVSIDPEYEDIVVNYNAGENELLIIFPEENQPGTIELLNMQGSQLTLTQKEINSLITRINVMPYNEHILIVRVVTPYITKVFKIIK